MNKVAKKQIAKRLEFIAVQKAKTGLDPVLIDAVIDKQQKQELAKLKDSKLDSLIQLGMDKFPEIAKFLEGMFGKDQVKVFRIIQIENEDKEAFTPENTKLQIGDTVLLKATGEFRVGRL